MSDTPPGPPVVPLSVDQIRLVRPTAPNGRIPFSEFWPDAQTRRTQFLRQYQTIRDRLWNECGIAFDVQRCDLVDVWTWDWLFQLFYNCDVQSIGDLRAMLEAARVVDRIVGTKHTLPSHSLFIEYNATGRMPGAGLCEINDSEFARAMDFRELVADPSCQPVNPDGPRQLLDFQGHPVDRIEPGSPGQHFGCSAYRPRTVQAYTWLDRLLDPRSLNEDELQRMNRTGYVICGRDTDNESWVGRGFKRYRDHVVRAIRDGIRMLALRHAQPIPADLDGIHYGQLLDTATTWLSAVPAGSGATIPPNQSDVGQEGTRPASVETTPVSEQGEGVSADGTEDHNDTLDEKEESILVEMFGAAVFSRREKLVQAEIVKKCQRGANPDSWKTYFSKLKRRGYLDSATGPAGGVWLTSAGKALAEKLMS